MKQYRRFICADTMWQFLCPQHLFELELRALIKNFEIVLLQNNTQRLFAKTVSLTAFTKVSVSWLGMLIQLAPSILQCINLWTKQQYASIIWPICLQPFKNSLFWSQVQPQNANIRLQTNIVGSWYHRLRQEQIHLWQPVSLQSGEIIMMSSSPMSLYARHHHYHIYYVR